MSTVNLRFFLLCSMAILLFGCNKDKETQCGENEYLTWYVNDIAQDSYIGDENGIAVQTELGEALAVNEDGSFYMKLNSSFNEIEFRFDSPLTSEDLAGKEGDELDDLITSAANNYQVLNFTNKSLIVTDNDGVETEMNADEHVISGNLTYQVIRAESGCRFFDFGITTTLQDILTGDQFVVQVNANIEYPE